MKKSCYITVLALAALVATSLFNYLPAATVTITLKDRHLTLVTGSILVTSALYFISITGTDSSADYITISITNVYGS